MRGQWIFPRKEQRYDTSVVSRGNLTRVIRVTFGRWSPTLLYTVGKLAVITLVGTQVRHENSCFIFLTLSHLYFTFDRLFHSQHSNKVRQCYVVTSYLSLNLFGKLIENITQLIIEIRTHSIPTVSNQYMKK